MMSLESALEKFGTPAPVETDATVDTQPAEEPVDGVELATGDTPQESAPDAAESGTDLRREIQREKLEAIKAKVADARAKRDAETILEQARREKAEAEAELARVRELKSDWRKLPDVLGVSAVDVLNGMTEQAMKDGTPEAMIEQMRTQLPELIKAEVAPLNEKAAQLEAKLAEVTEERDRLRNEQAMKAREQQARSEFMGIMAQEKFKPLMDEYEDDFIIENANALGKLWQSEGKSYTIHDIAEALLQAHTSSAGRRRREPPTNQSARTVNGAVAQAGIVGNSTAAGASATPRLTRRQIVDKLSRG